MITNKQISTSNPNLQYQVNFKHKVFTCDIWKDQFESQEWHQLQHRPALAKVTLDIKYSWYLSPNAALVTPSEVWKVLFGMNLCAWTFTHCILFVFLKYILCSLTRGEYKVCNVGMCRVCKCMHREVHPFLCEKRQHFSAVFPQTIGTWVF